jgi:hypothetical protein
MQFNRYNSRVLVSFHYSSHDFTDTFEFFNDLQMAYFRIIEYVDQHPGNWSTLLPFTKFADTLDLAEETLPQNERCIGICTNTIQIIVEYVE